ncbi:hypothetical protein [Tabrizicola aquatica]|uniref:hypothetical protein n=1 Tax=Tabrizicola aquatica TaxID=909926 RepID=UPI000CD0F3F3|nr:hypothetical protein [Tabrizicola aquatica]
MNKTLTATLLCALAATPALAGGPVVIEDETEVVAERPGNSILVPLLILLAVGVIASSGGDDTEECVPVSVPSC